VPATDGVEDGAGGGGDLGTDAVAGDECDAMGGGHAVNQNTRECSAVF
jgi:hypothetical protein